MKAFTKMIGLLSAMTLSFASIAAEKIIPVRMIILTESNGQGNEVWRNTAYTDAVMKRINEEHYKSNEFELKIVSKLVVRNSKDYHSRQKSLRGKYGDRYNKNGEIIVVLSREEKVDYNGIAAKQGVTYAPYFVMRAVRNSDDPKSLDYIYGHRSIVTSAGLFVHEMGHMLNLNHADRTSSPVHTENYTKVAGGTSIWMNYFRKLASYSNSSTPGTGGGSTTGGGGGGGRRDPPPRYNLH